MYCFCFLCLLSYQSQTRAISLCLLSKPSIPAGSSQLTMFAPCSVRLSGSGLNLPLCHAPKCTPQQELTTFNMPPCSDDALPHTDGAHTEEALREVGIDPAPLLKRGVAATSWSVHYLPAAPAAASLPLPSKLQRARQPATKLAGAVVPDTAAYAVSAIEPVAADATTSAHSATKEGACPVCLGAMLQPIRLSCAHALCADCAGRCSDAGHERCPVCRHPHLLDPKQLGARRDAWRAAYGGWRKGAASGAAGEVASIVLPGQRDAVPARAYSLAGELIRCGGSVPNFANIANVCDVGDELPPSTKAALPNL